MVEYPTLTSTQSLATSLSSSSAPGTPSQIPGLLKYPFPGNLINDYRASASSPYDPASTIRDCSLAVSICENPCNEDLRLDPIPTASYAISGRTRDDSGFYKSSAVSSPSPVPTASAQFDFALDQQHTPVMLHQNIPPEGHPNFKQEEDLESWFNDHILMERSHSSTNISSYQKRESSYLSTSCAGSAGLVSSPSTGFAAVSAASDGQVQQFATSPTDGIESGGFCKTPHTSDCHRPSVKCRTHSANTGRRYICSACDRAFDKRYNLREHEKKHDPSRVSQFSCPEPGCGKQLGRKTDVNRHIKSVHEKAKRFVCPRCLRRFDRKDTLSR